MMKVLFVLFIIFLVIVSIWATVDAPCEWFQYAAAKDIPGRCLMNG
jgi:hypothetical protein